MASEKKKTQSDKGRTAKELRELSRGELEAGLAEERRELLDMRFRHATAQLERTSSLKTARRRIARLETILREKE
jgi:large subunit ribosomal protein L29